jgi:hypothetical protein
VLGTAGDSFLGGDDLDERLVDHMAASFLASQRIDLRANEVAIMRLRAVAEQTKIELSRRTRAIVKVDEIAYGPGGAPLDLQIEVTRDELASQYPVVITVNRPSFELRLWKNLQLVKTYKIAVGQVGLETPAGLYHVQNKAVNPAWHVPNSAWAGDLAGTVVPGGTAENPLKARWLGIFDGAGIHGTDATYSLGTAASHGCIRMAIPDVVELYDQVPVGAPVYIA